MKLQAEISDKKYDVDLRREDGRVIATIDDRNYELDVSEPEPGVFLFKHEGRIFQASVSDPKAAHGITKVRVGTSEINLKLIDPKRLRSVGRGAEQADGLAEIRTAMPGKVVRILLQAGAEVEAGGGVLVVEAMKMQNELKSPKAGTVKDIRVKEGDAVSAGDILATIE